MFGTNPDARVHYDSKTGKTKTCYVVNILKQRNSPSTKKQSSLETFPEGSGESDLYHKLGDMSKRLTLWEGILKKCKRRRIYSDLILRFQSQCVKDLEMFDKYFFSPVVKILKPYHDGRVTGDWRYWFKVEMESLKYGNRGAGYKKSNLIQTGEWVGTLSKDPNFDLIITPYAEGVSSAQIKRKMGQTLKDSEEVLGNHHLNMALEHWARNRPEEIIVNTLEEIHKSLTQARNAKRNTKANTRQRKTEIAKMKDDSK